MTDQREARILIREAAALALELHGRRLSFSEACDHLRSEGRRHESLAIACQAHKACASLFIEEQRALPIR